MSTINSTWTYDKNTGDLSITLIDSVFSDGAPTFETWVDNTDSSTDPLNPDFKNIGQAGGSSVVELSNDNKTATVKSGWISNFKLDNGENAIYIKVYNANNSRSNLLNLANNQGLTVITTGTAAGATLLTGSVDPTSTTSSSVGAGGDPYIVTLNNKLYKMANFQGYSRMIQGYHQNKLLTINVSTRMSTEMEAEDSKQYVIDNMKKMEDKYTGLTAEFEVMDYLNKNEAFMDKIFVSWGNEYIIVDMDKLDILDNKSNFTITNLGENSGKSFKDIKPMEHYKVLNDSSIQININNLLVIVSSINNPQVRTSFNIQNSELITEGSGPLVNTLFAKDMRIKKFNCIKPIKRTNDRNARRSQTEYYINNENEKIYKEIPIY